MRLMMTCSQITRPRSCLTRSRSWKNQNQVLRFVLAHWYDCCKSSSPPLITTYEISLNYAFKDISSANSRLIVSNCLAYSCAWDIYAQSRMEDKPILQMKLVVLLNVVPEDLITRKNDQTDHLKRLERFIRTLRPWFLDTTCWSASTVAENSYTRVQKRF